MSEARQRTFNILRTLGRGGFGEVYLAEMISPSGLTSTVAVKVLHSGLDPRSQAIRRLKDEGRILSLLRHPAIVAVHDLAILEGRVALVTEFVEGADLPECVTGEAPMPRGALYEAMAAVADALDAAHQARDTDGEALGLLHRDIKPGNIRIGRHGQVKLLDFGIATATGIDREANTQTNALIGSFPYMAPERFRRNKPVGPESDVYSLGCTLYECLTNERLYPQDDMAEIVAGKATAHDTDAVLEAALEALPDDLLSEAEVALLTEMLAFEPSKRPVGDALVGRLEDLAAELGGVRLKRWARSRSWPDAESSDPGPLSGRLLFDGASTGGSETVQVDNIRDLTEEQPAPPPPKRRRAMLWFAMAIVGLLGGSALAAVVVAVGVWAMQDGGTDTAQPDPVEQPDPVAPDVPDPDPATDTDADDGSVGTDDPPDDPEPSATNDPRPRERPDPVGPDPEPADDGVAATATPSRGADDVIDCGDEAALQDRAVNGGLSATTRSCLGEGMRRKGPKMTRRAAVGRILLADARARCQAGKSCADFERHMDYFLEEVDQSDADLLFLWASYLVDNGQRSTARRWIARALERRDQWAGKERIDKEKALRELDARNAYEMWRTQTSNARLRSDARDAAVRWASYLGDLGLDATPAMDLCASAAGSVDPCQARVNDAAAVANVTFTSMPAGGEVLVNGDSIGKTPVSETLNYGTHQVEIRLKGTSTTKDFEVGTGKPTRWHYEADGASWSGVL